jgi:hypothetical protein
MLSYVSSRNCEEMTSKKGSSSQSRSKSVNLSRKPLLQSIYARAGPAGVHFGDILSLYLSRGLSNDNWQIDVILRI